MNSITIKNCLRIMLLDELERINSYITKNIIKDNDDEDITCIVKLFLNEKFKVI